MKKEILEVKIVEYVKNVFNPALVWWGITNPNHIFCYTIKVFGNTIFLRPVYLLLIYHRTQQLALRRSGANNNGELQTFLSDGISYTPPD